jgi:hypothetical protein
MVEMAVRIGRTRRIILGEPIQKPRSDIITLFPTLMPFRLTGLTPMRRVQPRLETHEVRDGLDEPAGSGSAAVVLEDVDEFVED